MKQKIIIIASSFLVLVYSIIAVIPTTNAYTYGWVNMFIPDVKLGYVLSPVEGIYRIFEEDGFTIDYNIRDYTYTFNGEFTADISDKARDIMNIYTNMESGNVYTINIEAVSGGYQGMFQVRYSSTRSYYITASSGNSLLSPIGSYDKIGFYPSVNTVWSEYKIRIMMNPGATNQPFVPADLSKADIELGTMFEVLYDLVQVLAKQTGNMWSWLNEEHLIGFKVFGFDLGFSVVPITYLGVGVVGLLFLWLVKSIVPGA